ncbi:MAG: adaptor protein MecA [Oscillospiraceae bacterium]|nr:adaptor protein MecA [Oscillospiraceae bacterium]
MEIEHISDKEIRITMTVEDLADMDLDINDLNEGNMKASNEFLLRLLKKAEPEIGFSPKDEHLVIECSSGEGVYEFIVKKLEVDDSGDFELLNKYIKSKYKRSELKAKRRARKVFYPIDVYTFPSSEAVSDLAKAAYAMGYEGLRSTAYYLGDAIHLVVDRPIGDVTGAKALEALLGEFGVRQASPLTVEAHLSEHGSLIAEGDALTRFAQI